MTFLDVLALLTVIFAAIDSVVLLITLVWLIRNTKNVPRVVQHTTQHTTAPKPKKKEQKRNKKPRPSLRRSKRGNA